MAESLSSADLINKIERAFSQLQIPDEVVEMEGRFQIDSDVEDGLWFRGRDWRELTNADWEKRHWGFGFLNSKASAYYLPSILVLAIQNPKICPLVTVDALLCGSLTAVQAPKILICHCVSVIWNSRLRSSMPSRNGCSGPARISSKCLSGMREAGPEMVLDEHSTRFCYCKLRQKTNGTKKTHESGKNIPQELNRL